MVGAFALILTIVGLWSTGLAVILVGLVPKATGLIWLYLCYSFFVVYLGSLLQFPEWMADISPFGHVPQIPIEDMNFTKIAVLTIVALVLIVAGFVGYNKRDVEG